MALAGAGLSESSDPFDLYFTGNGSAVVDIFAVPYGPTVSTYAETGFTAVDPNTGLNALTYALPEQIISGIIDITTASLALNGAISFYDSGNNGYMAEYANSGGQLDQTISSSFVPSPYYSVAENALGQFIWEPGGSYRADNDYFGTINSSVLYSIPDGGLTLGLLGAAVALLGAASRKLRK
jgi:hypothetical protein